MSASAASTAGLVFSVGFACWVIRYFQARAHELSELSGPPNPSPFTGNLDDVRSARGGTRYNVWQAEYGATYRMHGALWVRASRLNR
jgi:hypothetical protein